jgi:methylthioribose-1-phosphate isomerase
MLNVINNKQIPDHKLSRALVAEASKIENTEIENSYKIGRYGAKLIKNKMSIMTICNTGRLAVPGIGSALGVIYTAHKQGKKIHVYVLETRPLLQGARLTAFELQNLKIPYTLITDNMMGTVMKNVDIVLAGADRIAQNGDTANKIGTLTLAITAHYYQVPFYIVAPTSTIDLSKKTGKEIIIEERNKNEIIYLHKQQIAPAQSNVFNPAFDVTPHKLITGIVTEKGIIRPPYNKTLKNILNKCQISNI